MLKQVHLKIRGVVQGVCYRSWARDQALELGLKGWVKNLPDGGVEAVAVGEEAQLKRFISLCYEGPSGARVAEVKEHWEDTTKKVNGFEIKY